MNIFTSIVLLLALMTSANVANAAGSMLRVTCEGDGIGAEVKINGKFKGECPLDMQLPEGQYKLRVYKPMDASNDGVFEQDIRLGDGIVKKVEAVLSVRLTAAGQAEAAKREARVGAEIAENMIRIPGKNYEMGKTEVTQGQWKAIMGNNPSHFSNCGDTCPVEQVSWDDIQIFLQKLNAKTGKQYRLPTEAEWEYACYGGSQTEYCGGNDLNAVGWFNGNSNNQTHPAGQKQANGYGLVDMSGNVFEWQSDCWEGDCAKRVLRGGSWDVEPQYARAAYRFRYGTALRSLSFGFRLARMLP